MTYYMKIAILDLYLPTNIENQEIQPLSLYRKLNKISQAPFSAFLKLISHRSVSRED